MFASTSDVKKAFIALLYKNPPTVTDPTDNITQIPVPFRFYKKSSVDYTEEQLQQMYPVIAIQDYTPKISPLWNPNFQEYYANYIIDPNPENNSTATKYYQPAYLRFRFDVSSACLHYLQNISLEDYFSPYLYGVVAIFNEVDFDDGAVGEPVSLKVTPNDLPREDGVFETNYEFLFDAWVQIRTPEDVDLITQFIWNLESIAPPVPIQL